MLWIIATSEYRPTPNNSSRLQIVQYVIRRPFCTRFLEKKNSETHINTTVKFWLIVLFCLCFMKKINIRDVNC